MRTFLRLTLFTTLGALLVWGFGGAWAAAPETAAASAVPAPAAPAPAPEAPSAPLPEGVNPAPSAASASPPAAADAPAAPGTGAPAAAAADGSAKDGGGTLAMGGAALRKVPTEWTTRLRSAVAILLILAVGFAMSSARGRTNWALVVWGLGLQFTFALFIFQPIWMSLVLLSVLMLGSAVLQSNGRPLADRLLRRGKTVAPVLGIPVIASMLPAGDGASSPLAQLRQAILHDPLGRTFFDGANSAILKLLSFTEEGSGFLLRSMVTGKIEPAIANFMFQVLPTIIFFSALMSVLYHLGIMQVVVRAMAGVMQRTMGTSGAESMSAAANIFLGQTEAPLVVKPYVPEMTDSELMAIMTGGFATVAGGVLAAYVGMLKGYFPDIAGHLMAASIMNAPAGLLLAKLVVPETGVPKTSGKSTGDVERVDANVIGAAARGAGEGVTLVLNVGAMLLAFIALIACVNFLISRLGVALGSTSGMFWASAVVGACVALYYRLSGGELRKRRIAAAACIAFLAAWWLVFFVRGPAPLELTLQAIIGALLKPVAWLIGVPWEDAAVIGGLLGEKLVLNEFFAYAHLGQIVQGGTVPLSERAVTLATYGLLGFANFSSIAIQIGGIGGIAPTRRQDLARLGMRAMIAGTLAAYLSACVASILIP